MNEEIKTRRGTPWWVALLAALELVFGFILLSFPFLLGASAIWVGGFFFVAVGIMRMIEGIRMPHNKLWNFLAAIVYVIIGGCMIAYPDASLAMWTLVIGCALLAAGVFRLAMAFMLTKSPGSAWRFFSAIISLILGAMVTFGWPESSIWFIGTVIAVEMIFSGWTLLFMALAPQEKKLA